VSHQSDDSRCCVKLHSSVTTQGQHNWYVCVGVVSEASFVCVGLCWCRDVVCRIVLVSRCVESDVVFDKCVCVGCRVCQVCLCRMSCLPSVFVSDVVFAKCVCVGCCVCQVCLCRMLCLPNAFVSDVALLAAI
jgi:hypothetical protein